MTPNEIQSKQFDKAMSGYRPDDVAAYLQEVARYVEDLVEEKTELEQKLMVLAEKLEEYREDEDSLRAALIGAQKLGDSVVRESKRKAEQILAEAQQKADSMVAQIRVNIEHETDTLNKMQAEVARFKSQILSTYRQHIESINSIPYNEKDYPPAGKKQPQSEPQVHAPATVAAPAAVVVEPKKQPSAPAPAEPAATKDFIVSFEDDPDLEYEEFPEEFAVNEAPKKESRHGDLLFGERYPLTRKE